MDDFNDGFNYEDWVAKCCECAHCYRRKTDEETFYCRLRSGECKFKQYKPKEKKDG